MRGELMDTRVAQLLDNKGHEVFSTTSDQTVYAAIEKMNERDIGALLVMDDGHLDGIITERDYMRKVILEGRSSKETNVSEIMTEEVVVVDPDFTVKQCLAIMTEVRCRHLPVLEGEEVVGVVSIGDCARQISSDQQAAIRYLTEYIAGRYPG